MRIGLTATIEAKVLRDDHPDQKTMQAFGAIALARMAKTALQLDIGGAAWSNRDVPNAKLNPGISQVF